MRIHIKPKNEATDQYNIRIPVSLKHDLETLKTRAAELGFDFNATLVDTIQEFRDELKQRLDGPAAKRIKRGPNKTLGQAGPPNGIDLERA